MLIILPSLLSSGSHSPLLTQRIFISLSYFRSGSNFGVIKKYCPLSARQVVLTSSLCTARSARWSMPWVGSGHCVPFTPKSATHLINLINQREWRPCVLSHTHEVQYGCQRTFLGKYIADCMKMPPATKIVMNDARHQIACELSTVAAARCRGT